VELHLAGGAPLDRALRLVRGHALHRRLDHATRRIFQSVVAVRLAAAELLTGHGREVDPERFEDRDRLAHEVRRLPRVAAKVEEHVDLLAGIAVLLGPFDLAARDLQVLALDHRPVEIGVVEVADRWARSAACWCRRPRSDLPLVYAS
jgi:hypothetical protein